MSETDHATDRCGRKYVQDVTIRQPKLRVTYTIEQGTSLSECVREAESALAVAGAGDVISCEVAGNDEDGWYVTVVGEGTVMS